MSTHNCGKEEKGGKRRMGRGEGEVREQRALCATLPAWNHCALWTGQANIRQTEVSQKLWLSLHWLPSLILCHQTLGDLQHTSNETETCEETGSELFSFSSLTFIPWLRKPMATISMQQNATRVMDGGPGGTLTERRFPALHCKW